MVHKVLLADDSPTIHQIVVNALSDSDFQLIAVRDGQQAIEQMDKMTPDIILAKAIMPKVDGYQLCEYVRQTPHLAHIPLILLVSRFQPYDKERDIKAGVSRMMFKPFLPEQLMRQMEQLLEERPAAPAHEPAPRGFDEGATVAISPEDLRAHLQSLDKITRSQDEEMPSIDDFQLADEGFVEDDEPEAVDQVDFADDATIRAEEPLELSTEDLDDLELDDDEVVDDFDDAATLVAEPYDMPPDELGEDSLESLELEDSSPDLDTDFALEDEASSLPSSDFAGFEEAPEAAEELTAADEDAFSLEDSGELVSLEDSGEHTLDDSGQLELVDDSLEELGLEDMVGEHEELNEEAATAVVDDDTQPVDMDSLSAALPAYDEALDESAELELELDEDVDFDTAPSADEDVLGLNRPDSGEFESYSESADPSEASTVSLDSPMLAFVDELPADEPMMDALAEPEVAFAEPEDEAFAALDDDHGFSAADEDLFAEDDDAFAEEPAPTAETERFTEEPITDFAMDEVEDEAAFGGIDEVAPDVFEAEEIPELEDHFETSDELDDIDLGDHEQEEVASGEFAAAAFELEPSGAETIRVEEPLIQPEEAAYFADTVRSDQPLLYVPPPEPEPVAPEPEVVAAPAPAPAALPAAPMAAIALDEQQMNRLADMVVKRLVERLGAGEVRDIVWQVVPELAEAMIKKRIYQLEQSVEAE